MLSASNQVYQTLANLIRWSDNILLYGEKSAEKDNVREIVQAVREAVKVRCLYIPYFILNVWNVFLSLICNYT